MSWEMYTEQILDLYRNPLNFGKIEGATHEGKGENPLCGDEVIIRLVIESGKVKDVRFEGVGCAISIASASLLTEEIKGKSVGEVEGFFSEDLVGLLGIPISSARMKCALLPLAAMKEALKNGE